MDFGPDALKPIFPGGKWSNSPLQMCGMLFNHLATEVPVSVVLINGLLLIYKPEWFIYDTASLKSEIHLWININLHIYWHFNINVTPKCKKKKKSKTFPFLGGIYVTPSFHLQSEEKEKKLGMPQWSYILPPANKLLTSPGVNEERKDTYYPKSSVVSYNWNKDVLLLKPHIKRI